MAEGSKREWMWGVVESGYKIQVSREIDGNEIQMSVRPPLELSYVPRDASPGSGANNACQAERLSRRPPPLPPQPHTAAAAPFSFPTSHNQISISSSAANAIMIRVGSTPLSVSLIKAQ